MPRMWPNYGVAPKPFVCVQLQEIAHVYRYGWTMRAVRLVGFKDWWIEFFSHLWTFENTTIHKNPFDGYVECDWWCLRISDNSILYQIHSIRSVFVCKFRSAYDPRPTTSFLCIIPKLRAHITRGFTPVVLTHTHTRAARMPAKSVHLNLLVSVWCAINPYSSLKCDARAIDCSHTNNMLAAGPWAV